jgi:hypothetical protein
LWTQKNADRLKDVMEKPNLKMLSAPVLENQKERIGDLLYGFCFFIGGSGL